MNRRLGFLGAMIAVTACADIVPPAPRDGYEYRQILGTDTLSFKWDPGMLPVKIWIADDSPLRPHLVTAISRWEAAFTYGEFQATLVSDSSRADIIVRHAPPSGGSALRLAAVASQCLGETNFQLGAAPKTLQLPWRVHVWPASNPDATGIQECYSTTVTHELGHALGIMNANHTGTLPTDVMYRDPVADGLSERDRNTMERLYHSRTTLTAVPRP